MQELEKKLSKHEIKQEGPVEMYSELTYLS